MLSTLMLCAAVCGLGQIDQANGITVTGTSVTRVAPDIASWDIKIWDQGQLADAKASDEQKTQAVLNVIRELGVDQQDVQTDYLRVEQQYDQKLLPRRVSIGWTVSRSIKFKQRDLARFDEFVDRLLKMADVDVRYTLETSRYHDLRKETRLAAMRVAKEKAEAMCTAVGAKLGDVVGIQEQPQFSNQSYDPWWGGWGFSSPSTYMSNSMVTAPSPAPAMDEVSDQTTMAPGLIDIAESVRISFAVTQ